MADNAELNPYEPPKSQISPDDPRPRRRSTIGTILAIPCVLAGCVVLTLFAAAAAASASSLLLNGSGPPIPGLMIALVLSATAALGCSSVLLFYATWLFYWGRWRQAGLAFVLCLVVIGFPLRVLGLV